MPRNAALARTDDVASRYNVYMEGCPARLVFSRLADKWSLLIVKILRDDAQRFNQLRREIGGISPKALSQTLQKLERDGLVHREAFATVPVTVEYSLTELGRTLSELVDPLVAWAENHIEEVLRSQNRFDDH
ncbi:putative HTH-type transcriptional regulator YybR [Pandoraea pneumonica]|jgi:DNA-binding HxlR family transcriptional regulator|uniref:Putative HTH-type transcriptional regulator YybR n=1 Tax=Pandoraea pneumonica TaxID=2508299 RepID=A0A5E4S9T9_9BURK|nr:helix-turn-helix domain-containing protein [Pandoraea pneumonica]VVD72075.1 putative HTH-type transcriptional regulator YybR [Pandoraea pneumonica]